MGTVSSLPFLVVLWSEKTEAKEGTPVSSLMVRGSSAARRLEFQVIHGALLVMSAR